jgi:hypothetical protein
MPTGFVAIIIFFLVLFQSELSIANGPKERDSSAAEEATDFIDSFRLTDGGLFSNPSAEEKQYFRSILPGQEKNVWSDDVSEIDYEGRNPNAYTLAKALSLLFRDSKTIHKKWMSREGFLRFHLEVNLEGYLSDTRAFIFRPLTPKQRDQLAGHWIDFEGTYTQYLLTMASLIDAGTKTIRQQLLSPEGFLIHHELVNPGGKMAITLANAMAVLNDEQQQQLRRYWNSCEKKILTSGRSNL